MDNKIKKRFEEHNHVPDITKIKAKRTLEELKTIVIFTLDATHKMVANAAANVTEVIAGQLPFVKSIKNTIRRIRNQSRTPLLNLINL